jgi:NADPH:quinone reductase-like Zn-dependent oxidoreductase
LKAILLPQHGDINVLKFESYPAPIPQSGYVQVKLSFAALNRMDILVREGWKGLKINYPHILGADGAGVISAIGKGVTSINVGTPVVLNANIADGTCSYCLNGLENQCKNWHLLGETINGTYAEYICVPEKNVLEIPPTVSKSEAAAASLVYQTAWHSIITKGNLIAGETVLIVGASGGVNTASIQIAKLAGAKVIVIGSNQEKLALAESLGADYLINRIKMQNWEKEVFKITKRTGVDIVVDNVGTTFHQSIRSLRVGGRLLTVGNTGAPIIKIDNRYIFGKHLSIIGSTMGTIADFNKVMGLVFDKKLTPVIDRTFPLRDAKMAQQHLMDGNQMGKVLLNIE